MEKLKKEAKGTVKREEITIGYKCNIRCRFCYYGCSPNDAVRGLEAINKDILLSMRYGIEHIELSGGEPMLHGDISSVIDFCRDKGFKTICMITNGTMLTDIDKMKSLRERGLNQFVFSLHGAHSETHNYLTRGDTFSDILKAMRNAETLRIPFRINIVVTKKNYKELSGITNLIIGYRPIMVNYLIYSPLEFSRNFAQDMAARYSEMSFEIAKAVDIAKSRMGVRIRYMPFCIMKGYEKYICNVHQLHYDPYEWDYIVREHIHNGLFYKWAKILVGLLYVPLERILSQKLNNTLHEAIIKTMCLINSCKPMKCRSCKYYYMCDGLWKDYASIYGVKELMPVKGKKILNPAGLLAD